MRHHCPVGHSANYVTLSTASHYQLRHIVNGVTLPTASHCQGGRHIAKCVTLPRSSPCQWRHIAKSALFSLSILLVNGVTLKKLSIRSSQRIVGKCIVPVEPVTHGKSTSVSPPSAVPNLSYTLVLIVCQ